MRGWWWMHVGRVVIVVRAGRPRADGQDGLVDMSSARRIASPIILTASAVAQCSLGFAIYVPGITPYSVYCAARYKQNVQCV